MSTDRNRIIDEIGSRLHQAARASVAQGAMYDPGEKISRDAEGAWRGVAETLVNYVDVALREKLQGGPNEPRSGLPEGVR